MYKDLCSPTGTWCCYIQLYSLQSPDSFDKNSNFTLQSKGVAGLALPRLNSLFMLLCDFNVLKGLFGLDSLEHFDGGGVIGM